MAGAYSSTYNKLQAQGQLLHPSMQLGDADMHQLDADTLMTGTQWEPVTGCTLATVPWLRDVPSSRQLA